MKNIKQLKKKGIRKFIFDQYIYILTGLCITMFSACSQYQYVSVNSKLNQTEEKDFINENDTVMIKYTFSGQNLPVRITIFNKLQKPIYIDWGRTTIIFNNEQLNGAFQNNENIISIAPQAYVVISSIPLASRFFDLNKNDSIRKLTFETNNGTLTNEMHLFNEHTTPQYFRCILAITTREDFSAPTYFDNSFWVSGVFKTMVAPASIKYKASNFAFVRKTSGFGKAISVTAVLMTLIVVHILNPS